LSSKDTVIHLPRTRKMMKSIPLLAVLLSSSLAQDYSYGQQGYANARDGAGGHSHTSPASGYGAPDAGYGAPDAGYGAPDAGYGAPASGYGYVQDTVDGGFDIGSKLSEFLPILLVVFAAIILASLLAPLITQLLILLAGLLPLSLELKAPIVNALLAPFNLVLASFPAGEVPAITNLSPFPAGRAFDGRAFAESAFQGFGLDITPEHLDILTNFAQRAISSLSESADV